MQQHVVVRIHNRYTAQKLCQILGRAIVNSVRMNVEHHFVFLNQSCETELFENVTVEASRTRNLASIKYFYRFQ